MTIFQYKAVDKKGDIIVDTISSDNKNDLAALLKRDGYKILTIKNIESGTSKLFEKPVSLAEKANMFRFLSTMLKSGLSVAEGVDVIKRETQSKRLARILAELSYQTRRGGTVISVLEKHKDDFDPVILALVKVGEESGTLDRSFRYLAKEITATYELDQKIKGSLMYPAVIVFAMSVVGLYMMLGVLPKIATSVLKLNIELPPMTMIIMRFGNFVGENTFLVIGLIVGSIVLMVVAFLIKPIRNAVLNLIVKIGPIKKTVTQMDVARYSRTLSILSKRGVPIVSSLDIAAQTIRQKKMREIAANISEEVSKGKLISDSLVGHKDLFPGSMVQTVKAGERTGSLDQVLAELASFYEGEVERSVKKMTTLLEPVLILVVGVIVGVMVVLIIAPIYGVIGGLQESISK